MATTLHLYPVQSRNAGQYVSGTASYAGGAVSCRLQIVDVNWTTEPTALAVTLYGEESFDGGTTWLNAIGPYVWHPPGVDRHGNPPGAGFTAGNDGAGSRLVRATLTIGGVASWGGGVDLTLG